jgi:hypothetical protein
VFGFLVRPEYINKGNLCSVYIYFCFFLFFPDGHRGRQFRLDLTQAMRDIDNRLKSRAAAVAAIERPSPRERCQRSYPWRRGHYPGILEPAAVAGVVLGAHVLPVQWLKKLFSRADSALAANTIREYLTNGAHAAARTPLIRLILLGEPYSISQS